MNIDARSFQLVVLLEYSLNEFKSYTIHRKRSSVFFGFMTSSCVAMSVSGFCGSRG